MIDEMRKTGVIPDGVGEYVPIPEEVLNERNEFKRILASLHDKSFQVTANIFTLAIIMQRDLYEDLSYCERVFECYESPSNVPVLEPSLQFLALLADKMNCPLSIFFSMTEENRKKAVYDLLGKYKDRVNTRQAIYEYDDDFEKEITQKINIWITLEDLENGMEIRESRAKQQKGLDDTDPYYQIVMGRSWDEERNQCVYSLSYEQNEMFYYRRVDYQYIYTNSEIYMEYEGELADLIEQIIELESPPVTTEAVKERDNSLNKEADELCDANSGKSEPIREEKLKQVREINKIEKPEETDYRGKIKRKTLIAYIHNDTKTIDIFDQFEGIGDNNPYVYEKLEIPSAMNIWKGNKSLTVSLVVKRCRASECAGDITITEFKQDKIAELREYVSQQITDNAVEKYKGKRDIFYFEKPYHLRAQNSSNRTGYGWEWDWSGGVGDYTEGTMYGETTDYGFVGAYIR